MSLFKVVEIEKITKNKPSLLFTNNGSFFINNFSKNHRIFVEEKLHLGIDCKQACISALGLQYLCRRKAAPRQFESKLSLRSFAFSLQKRQ